MSNIFFEGKLVKKKEMLKFFDEIISYHKGLAGLSSREEKLVRVMRRRLALGVGVPRDWVRKMAAELTQVSFKGDINVHYVDAYKWLSQRLHEIKIRVRR